MTRTRQKHNQSGFTILEMAIVISIMFLILGAVTIGRDVHRNAAYQRISSDFVQGWILAYETFVLATGNIPGDTTPATGIVNGTTNTPLCGTTLLGLMQAAGIAMPTGRTEGQNDRAVYLDTNGVPHELQICFNNVAWAEPGATVNTYVARNRNVMELRGITPALALLIDNQIDGKPDARFGQLREKGQQSNVTPVPDAAPANNWTLNETVAFGETTSTTKDESQVVELQALVKMSR
jgi:type II secretory pathway pseudopilin PulG